MYLVHEKKLGHGKWEVAWTWLPYFLASDQKLVKRVDEVLTKRFKGVDLTQEDPERLMELMHNQVLETILSSYPIKGLKEYLESVEKVKPEERA